MMPIRKTSVQVVAKTPKGKQLHGEEPFTGMMWTAVCPVDMDSMALLQVMFGPEVDFFMPAKFLERHRRYHQIAGSQSAEADLEAANILNEIKEMKDVSRMVNVLYEVHPIADFAVWR